MWTKVTCIHSSEYVGYSISMYSHIWDIEINFESKVLWITINEYIPIYSIKLIVQTIVKKQIFSYRTKGFHPPGTVKQSKVIHN